MVLFKSGKEILLKGCSDVTDYYLKNAELYKRLYPHHSEARLRKIALLDWNEMIPEDVILEGSLESEKKFIEELGQLRSFSVFHEGGVEDLLKIERSLEKFVTKLKSSRQEKTKQIIKDSIKPLLNQALDMISPSLDSVHSLELSEETHIQELSALLEQDEFLKSVLRKTDERIEDSLSSFDISSRFGKTAFAFPDMAKKVVAILEEFIQSLEIQKFSINEILLELNRAANIVKITENINNFKKSLPSVKKGIIFFSRIESINSQLISNLDTFEQGIKAGSWNYIDEEIGLPEIKKRD